jgi:lipopolysaccharide/colanic/teichoic acid biosynthesis glycosyltransferase
MPLPLESDSPLELAPAPPWLGAQENEWAPASDASALAWDELAPAGTYARLGRPLLRFALLGLCLPLGIVLGIPIALANAVQFGGVQGVFFRQRRVGLRGGVFWILKFRTMHGSDGECDAWRQGEDLARVTRFGRFLRSTHLDELPQLVNILRGEMDFIGPRPEMVAIDTWACARIPRFRERNAVRPGVTGLAQVTQGYTPREEQAYRRKLALDRHALACTSLRLDLEILARTALWMLRGRGWRADAPAARRGHA